MVTVPAAAAQAAEKVPPAAPELFNILGLPVTNSMICTWIVAAIILIVVRVDDLEKHQGNSVGNAKCDRGDGRRLGRFDRRYFGQARHALGFSVCDDFFYFHRHFKSDGFGSGRRQHRFWIAKARQYAAIFIEHVTPFFRPPTTDANLTVAMAGIFLVMSLYWAVRYNGVWGLVKHIFGVKMETSKLLYPVVFPAVPFHRRDGIAFRFCLRGRWRWRCGFTATYLPVKAFWT